MNILLNSNDEFFCSDDFEFMILEKFVCMDIVNEAVKEKRIKLIQTVKKSIIFLYY
jgi:hypothetical protein